jgi:hypothetical protein
MIENKWNLRADEIQRNYGLRARFCIYFEAWPVVGSLTIFVDNFVKKWVVKCHQAIPGLSCDRSMTNEAVKNTLKSMACTTQSSDPGIAHGEPGQWLCLWKIHAFASLQFLLFRHV